MTDKSRREIPSCFFVLCYNWISLLTTFLNVYIRPEGEAAESSTWTWALFITWKSSGINLHDVFLSFRHAVSIFYISCIQKWQNIYGNVHSGVWFLACGTQNSFSYVTADLVSGHFVKIWCFQWVKHQIGFPLLCVANIIVDYVGFYLAVTKVLHLYRAGNLERGCWGWWRA